MTEKNIDPIQKNVAAVRPVDWSVVAELSEKMGVEETPVYPGSVVDACSECEVAVYIGPKVQEAMSTDPASFTVLCFICAARDYHTRQQAGYNTEIRNLGNTNTGRPDAQA